MAPSGDEHLPFKPIDFMVLLALHEQERHGYGIVKDIERYSEGRVRLAPGNLYGVLARLLEWGLVEEAARRADDDPRRRRYRLSVPGRAALRSEARHMKRLAALVESRRLPRRVEGA